MSEAPAGLDERGAALWAAATAGATLGPLELVLLAEACRIVDRLERLDALIRGEGNDWIRLADEMEDRSEVAVVIDGALSESRQQQGRLTSIIAELRLRAAAAAPAGKPSTTGAPAPGPAEVPTGVASIIGRARSPRVG